MDGEVDQRENDHNTGNENKSNDQLPHTPSEEPSENKSSNSKDNQEGADSPADEPVMAEEGGADQSGQDVTPEITEVTTNPATSEPGEVSGDEVSTGADLPSSKTFEEGEAPEIKPLIGEPLSRESSFMLGDHDDEKDRPPALDPGTPERESCSPTQEDKDPSPVEETSAPGIDYQEYADLFRQLQREKEELTQSDAQLQTKLVLYFRKKTGDTTTRPEKEKGKGSVSDQEQRYHKYMATIQDLKRQHRRDSEAARLQADELRLQTQEKLAQVERERSAFAAQKRDVAVAALSRGGSPGKPAARAEVERIQAQERRGEDELARVRLENVKAKNETGRLEATLRGREELAEGLHLIDFEQLKIENQTYGEKIEERNEELLKLRNKTTGTVQVLTHVKEKLQSVQTENRAKRARLAAAEAEVAGRRDVLTRTKRARDNLRTDNLRLRQRRGLLGNDSLLRDFEEKVDASEGLEERLEGLKRRNAEITLRCAAVKKKLQQAARPTAL